MRTLKTAATVGGTLVAKNSLHMTTAMMARINTVVVEGWSTSCGRLRCYKPHNPFTFISACEDHDMRSACRETMATTRVEQGVSARREYGRKIVQVRLGSNSA
jgi:hypothetical protein